MTNTSRTLEELRRRGFKCGMVERYNQYTKQRHDLFGIIDIIAIKEHEIWGVQSCGSSFAEHKKKMLASDMALKWLDAGGQLLLMGWRKIKKKRGGKAMVFRPREYLFTFNDWREE